MGEPFEIGSILDGRFEILDVLGQGAYGVVYKARQISTGQHVAVKVLLEQKLAFSANANVEHARFEREMKLIGQLKHPNIVRLIDSGQLEERGLFMALEFIDGINLADFLKENGPMQPRVARHLMSQVLDALSCAHALGIVHRDLKPHNIMVTTTGSRQNAMVLDFGIAGLVESARKSDYQSLTAQSQIQGTPAYMAPEYIREKKTTPPGDIYAWGLVFIECLTGERAVVGSNPLDIAMTQGSAVPVVIPDSIEDPHLRQVITRAVAKPLEERYPDAETALRELDEPEPSLTPLAIPAVGAPSAPAVASRPAEDSLGISPLAEAPLPLPPPEPRGVSVMGYVVIGLIVLALAAAGAFLLMGNG